MNISSAATADIFVNSSTTVLRDDSVTKTQSEVHPCNNEGSVWNSKTFTGDSLNGRGRYSSAVNGESGKTGLSRKWSDPELSTRNRRSIVSGVVLNASNVSHTNDARWLTDQQTANVKERELGQNHMVSSASELFSVDKKLSLPPTAKEEALSLWRKIVFGLSFLPAIIFVLFFTILLPCEKATNSQFCLTTPWNLTLNDSELRTDITLSNGLMLGLVKDGDSNITSFDLDTGGEIWSFSVPSPPRHINCKNFDANSDGIDDCLLVTDTQWDTLGMLHAYNVSNGYKFWTYSVDSDTISSPIILIDCDKDNVTEVAVATSSEILIISKGRKLAQLSIEDCMNIDNLYSWSRGNERVDIVFVCESESGAGAVRVVENAKWCVRGEVAVEAKDLLEGYDIDLRETLLLPSNDGLIVWVEQLVVFFGNNGSEVWRKTTESLSNSRSLVYGNFHMKGNQVGLVRNMGLNGTMITFLSGKDGTQASKWIKPNAEVKRIISVPGSTKDYLLLMLQVNESMKTEENAPFLTPHSNLHNSSHFSMLKTYFSSPDTSVKKFQLIFLYAGDKMKEKVLLTETKGLSEEIAGPFRIAAQIRGSGESRSLLAFLGRSIFSNLNLRYWTQLVSVKAEKWDSASAVTSYSCGKA